jgi:O-antigen/teichoic acid export membrane protein
VGQVFFGASARFRRGNERVVTRTLVALIMAMTAISAVALLLYLFVVPPILAAVFDEGWEQTGRFVQLLSFGFLAQGVAAATTSVVDVAQRQELQLLREGVRLVSTGIAAIVIVRSVDSPQAAVAAFSIVGVANAVVAIVISLIAARDVDAASATDANRDSYPRGV